MPRLDKEATRVYAKKYREKNRERLVEYNREYYTSNRSQVIATSIRGRTRKRTKIIEEFLITQGGKCPICLRSDQSFVLDHDYRDGRWRGALCRPCNTGIGHLGDDTDNLRRAIAYLAQYE